jgi:hypothetical protein
MSFVDEARSGWSARLSVPDLFYAQSVTLPCFLQCFRLQSPPVIEPTLQVRAWAMRHFSLMIGSNLHLQLNGPSTSRSHKTCSIQLARVSLLLWWG